MLKFIPERVIYKVSEITRKIKNFIEEEFNDFWIEGEISNFRIPSSGHFYFTLKDSQSQIKCAIFRYYSQYINFKLEDGIQVVCHGRLNLYEPRGEYQVIIDLIEPFGYGLLQKAFEQLKERLRNEGLFDEKHKRPIPVLPKTIGIITSPTGAAIRDILNILYRRYPNIHVIIFPVKVQGEGAKEEIVSAIYEAQNFKIDLLIVGRGGGSLEDLWAFNEEIVAYAIYNSKIPIISAVGHEIDYTIADFVADLRAPTPSAAAELAVPVKSNLIELIEETKRRLRLGIKKKLDYLQKDLINISKRLIDPRKKLTDIYLKLDDLQGRLFNAIFNILSKDTLKVRNALEQLNLVSPIKNITYSKINLSHLNKALFNNIIYVIRKKEQEYNILNEKLHSLNPLFVLKRGYSIVKEIPSKKVIYDISKLLVGDNLEITLYNGVIICKVIEIKK